MPAFEARAVRQGNLLSLLPKQNEEVAEWLIHLQICGMTGL